MMAPMTTMNISLTDDLKTFVDQQVVTGSFTSTSEYVRALLRREKAICSLRETVLAGSHGPYTPMDDAYFAALRAEVLGQTAHQ